MFGHADTDDDYCPRCNDWLPERTIRRATYKAMKALGAPTTARQEGGDE